MQVASSSCLAERVAGLLGGDESESMSPRGEARRSGDEGAEVVAERVARAMLLPATSESGGSQIASRPRAMSSPTA